MRKSTLIIILAVVLAGIGVFALSRDNGNPDNPPNTNGTSTDQNGDSGGPAAALAKRLEICESIPNGTTKEVVDTTRVFINLPEDVYPFESRKFVSNGATAGIITSGEGMPPQNSTPEEFNANRCVTHYYELSGNGTVDLEVKSAVAGTPDYKVRFVVKGS